MGNSAKAPAETTTAGCRRSTDEVRNGLASYGTGRDESVRAINLAVKVFARTGKTLRRGASESCEAWPGLGLREHSTFGIL